MTKTGWRSPAFVGLVVSVSLILAACGGGEGDDGNGATSPPAASGDMLVMNDFSFDPSSASFAAGTSLTLDNQGAALHNLSIEGSDVDVDVSAGETGQVTLDLDPGQYRMFCKYHAGRGMEGELTITG